MQMLMVHCGPTDLNFDRRLKQSLLSWWKLIGTDDRREDGVLEQKSCEGNVSIWCSNFLRQSMNKHYATSRTDTNSYRFKCLSKARHVLIATYLACFKVLSVNTLQW